MAQHTRMRGRGCCGRPEVAARVSLAIPKETPMLKVANLLARLDEAERLELLNAIGAGLHDARRAAQCTTDPDHHTQDVAQLLAYLS